MFNSQEVFSSVYIIHSLIDGKKYVGQSIHTYRRWNEHLRRLRSGSHVNMYLQKHYFKYGEDNFLFGVYDYTTKEKLDSLELSAILKYKTNKRETGFNLKIDSTPFISNRLEDVDATQFFTDLLGELPLKSMIIGTSNFYYLIDKEDYFKLQTYQWKDDHGCAFTFIDGKRTTMIELIMETTSPIKYKNGITLDLRKCNLEYGSSKYRGVRYRKGIKYPWEARVTIEGAYKDLGRYSTEIEAAIAVEKANLYHNLVTYKPQLFFPVEPTSRDDIKKELLKRDKSSKYKGVWKKVYPSGKVKWVAEVKAGKKIFLGEVDSEFEAHLLWKNYVSKHYPEKLDCKRAI